VAIVELHAIECLLTDLGGLKKLLVHCKRLQIEALYELTCCAIACHFKTRPNSYFQQQYSSARNPLQAPQLQAKQDSLFAKMTLMYDESL